MKIAGGVRDPFVWGMFLALTVGGLLYARKAKDAGEPPVERVPQALVAHLDSVAPPQRRGLPAAPVQVVQFGDYECPACRAAHLETEPILDRAVGSGTVAFTTYDLPLVGHARAVPAAVAAQCVWVVAPERFWAFRSLLYEQRDAWIDAYPLETALLRLTESVGASRPEVKACVTKRGASLARGLRAAWPVARTAGLRGIPLWTVNGKVVRWDRLENEIHNAEREAGS